MFSKNKGKWVCHACEVDAELDAIYGSSDLSTNGDEVPASGEYQYYRYQIFVPTAIWGGFLTFLSIDTQNPNKYNHSQQIFIIKIFNIFI